MADLRAVLRGEQVLVPIPFPQLRQGRTRQGGTHVLLEQSDDLDKGWGAVDRTFPALQPILRVASGIVLIVLTDCL